jgi:phosphatidate cytidylyltransferase
MLLTRLATAFVLLAIILPALFMAPAWVFQSIALLAMVLAAWEWGRMALPTRFWLFPLAVALLGGSAWAASFGRPDRLTILIAAICLFWLVYAPLWLRKNRSVKAGGLFIATVVLLGAWLAILVLHFMGVWFLISCFLIVWIADTGAYFAGRAFGKTKLAPSISPGKTQAGAVGAVISVLIYFMVVQQWFPNSTTFPGHLIHRFGLVFALLVACVLTGFSVMGDLIESKLKRECGVKDSGNTLPGHGGVLDRIDALLPVLPICALLSW